MNENIITVRRTKGGMAVEVSAGAEEALQAVANVIATAVWNMAAAGTPAAAIRQQIGICASYGIHEGMKKAKEEKCHE